MRIIVIDCRMIDSSGIGTYIKNIINPLIESNKFNIYCLGNDKLKNYDWFDKIKYISVKSRFLSIKEHFELTLKIPKCDIFWTPNWNTPFLPIKAKVRVVTGHDVFHLANPQLTSRFTKLIMSKLIKSAISKSKIIITVSQFSKSEIIKYTSCKEQKIIVIKSGVDDDFDKNFTYKKSEFPYFLCVGNVKPHKNITTAIQAMQYIKNDEYKLIIIGNKEGFHTGYSNLDQLEQMSDKVIFTGYVNDETLKNYYANAAALIFPSKYEGFGLPILEAMKMGIPIIASSIAPLQEVGGNVCEYFTPDSITELASKMNSIVDGNFIVDVEKYKQRLSEFSWKQSYKEHEAIFEELLEQV